MSELNRTHSSAQNQMVKYIIKANKFSQHLLSILFFTATLDDMCSPRKVKAAVAYWVDTQIIYEYLALVSGDIATSI